MKTLSGPVLSLDDPAFGPLKRDIALIVSMAFDKAALHIHDDKAYPLPESPAFERAIADILRDAPLLKRRKIADHGKAIHKLKADERAARYGRWGGIDLRKPTPLLTQCPARAPLVDEISGAAPHLERSLRRLFDAEPGPTAARRPGRPAARSNRPDDSRGEEPPGAGGGDLDGRDPSVTRNRMVLRIRKIECIKSTAELGRDEVDFMGGAFDGITAPIPISSGDTFGRDGRHKKRIKLKDGESEVFPDGAAVVAFNTAQLPERPIYSFAAVLMPFERDWAFSDPGRSLDSLISGGRGALTEYLQKELAPDRLKTLIGGLVSTIVTGAAAAGGASLAAVIAGAAVALGPVLWAAAVAAAVAGVCELIRKWLAHETFRPFEVNALLLSLTDLVDEDYILDPATIEVTNGKRAKYAITYDWRLIP